MNTRLSTTYALLKLHTSWNSLIGDMDCEKVCSIREIKQFDSLTDVAIAMHQLPFNSRPGGRPDSIISYHLLEIVAPGFNCKEIPLPTLILSGATNTSEQPTI